MANHAREANEKGEFWCSGCLDYRPKLDFNASKKTRAGIQSRCRDCAEKKRIQYHSEPRAHLLGLVNGASKRGRPFLLDREWAVRQFDIQGGRCYYTDLPMTFGQGNGRVWTNASLDRKDSNLGYTDDNCVLCCHGFNLMKTNLTLDAMELMAEAFLKKMESNRWLDVV